jgi:L-asparaginase
MKQNDRHQPSSRPYHEEWIRQWNPHKRITTMKIKIFTTGGTIDKVYFDRKSTYQVGEPQIVKILEEMNVTVDYDYSSILRKDSLDMTDEDRRLLHDAIKNEPCRHIVVTHGTDTMIDSAREVSTIRGKVIVFTGAIRPAGFTSSDAAFNIGAALAAVQILPDGVYIVMNGRIFDSMKARKNRERNRFEDL